MNIFRNYYISKLFIGTVSAVIHVYCNAAETFAQIELIT